MVEHTDEERTKIIACTLFTVIFIPAVLIISVPIYLLSLLLTGVDPVDTWPFWILPGGVIVVTLTVMFYSVKKNSREFENSDE